MASKLSHIPPAEMMRMSMVGALVSATLMLVAITVPEVHADEALDEYHLAIGLYKKSRWSIAADSFRKFLKDRPKHAKVPIARLYLGLTLVNLEEYRDARVILRKFVAEYPENRNFPDAMYRVGECSYFLDDLKAAESELSAFVKKFPEHELREWALPYLADTQLRLDNTAGAEANFRKLLEAYPESRMLEDVKFGLAQSYEKLEKNAEAIKLYRELAADETSPRAPEAQLNLAARHYEQGNYKFAARAYRTLEKRFPQSELVAAAQLNSGFALYQLGEFRDAITQFERAASQKEQSITAQFWKGMSHRALDEFAEGATTFQAGFKADKNGPLAEQSLYQWADCELRRGQYKAARKLFLDVVKRWPDAERGDDSLHFAIEADLLSGRLDDAEALVERFDRDYPQSSLQLSQELLRGRLLVARGGEKNQRAAALHFQKVLDDSKIAGTRSWARFHLARARQDLGDHKAVLEVVEPLVEEIRKNAASKLADALVLHGVSLLATNEFEKAAESLQLYLESRPRGSLASEALMSLAAAQANQADRAGTDATLTSFAEQFPKDPLRAKALQQVAEIAYAAEKWEWAEATFGELVKLGDATPHYVSGLSGEAWCRHQQKDYSKAAAGFARLVKEFPDEALAPEAAYMRGKSLFDAGRQEDAAAAFQAAFQKFSPDQPADAADRESEGFYAYRSGLEAARVLRSLKQVEQSDAAYEALLERFPKPENLDKLLDEWALLNYEAARYDRSDEIFRRVIRDTPKSDLADNAQLSLAESDYLAGKLELARKSLLELQSNSAADADVQQVSLNHLISIATEQRDWKEVRKRARELLSRYPQGKYQRDAEFRLGEALVNLNEPAEAKRTLLALKAAQNEPQVGEAEWRDRIWVLLAEIALDAKEYGKVAETTAELRRERPESLVLHQADEVLGRSLKNQAKFDSAREAFRRVTDDATGRKTETAAKAQFMIADTYLMQKDYRVARIEYLKVYHLYKFPRWQAPALYQAAACDEALQEWNKAENAYRDLLQEFAGTEWAKKAGQQLQTIRKRAKG
jgi:TolA-binding protein